MKKVIYWIGILFTPFCAISCNSYTVTAGDVCEYLGIDFLLV